MWCALKACFPKWRLDARRRAFGISENIGSHRPQKRTVYDPRTHNEIAGQRKAITWIRLKSQKKDFIIYLIWSVHVQRNEKNFFLFYPLGRQPYEHDWPQRAKQTRWNRDRVKCEYLRRTGRVVRELILEPVFVIGAQFFFTFIIFKLFFKRKIKGYKLQNNRYTAVKNKFNNSKNSDRKNSHLHACYFCDINSFIPRNL